jgi:secondary thiamine-phosphate synthase enzyme
MKSTTFHINTHAREEILIITEQVQNQLELLTSGEGLCTIFTPHTTAAITINENADPDVPADLVRALRAMIPDVRFDHGEGNSDSHLLSLMIGCSTTIPFRDGKLLLGQWQGIYFVELDGPRTREVSLHVIE